MPLLFPRSPLSTPFHGIVVDEERAKESPCIRIKGTKLVFSKGIIGALNEEQIKKYCPKIIEKEPRRNVICVNIGEIDKLIRLVEEKLKKLKRK